MAFTPLRIESSGDLQQETIDGVSPNFNTELFARLTQGKIEGSTLRKLAWNLSEEQDARLEDPQILSAEDANAEYGIENLLEFQGNTTRGEAKLKKFRILQNQDKERFIAKAAAADAPIEKIGNLFLSLGSMAASPETAIPWTKLVALRNISAFTKLGTFGRATVRGALDGLIGNVAAIPGSIANFQAIGEEYTFTDALIDTGAGAVGGGLLGVGGAGIRAKQAFTKRTSRIADSKLRNAFIGEFEKLETQGKVIKQQLTQEGRAALDTYLSAMTDIGEEADPNVIRAIGKLQTIFAADLDKNPHFLLNDILLRTDFDNLDSDVLEGIVESLGNTRLVPNDISFDLPRVKALFKAKRFGELPAEVASIFSKLKPGKAVSKFQPFLTVREFTESIGELANLKTYKDVLTEVVGGKFTPESILSEQQALTLFKELDEIQHFVKTKTTNKDLLLKIKELQIDIKKAKNGTDLSLKQYSKKLNGFKTLLDNNPNLRSLSLAEISQLDDVTRAQVTEFLAFIQKANPNEVQLKGFLRGDKKVFQELYESAKLNNELKDSLTEAQATKILTDSIQSNGKPRIEASGEEAATFTSDLKASVKFLNEKADVFKANLDEVEIQSIEDFVTKEDNKFRRLMKGAKEALDCFLGK
jgi:hypothetical protein